MGRVLRRFGRSLQVFCLLIAIDSPAAVKSFSPIPSNGRAPAAVVTSNTNKIPTTTTSSPTTAIATATTTDEAPPSAEALKDYRGEASSLFGNIRLPAALFAGASAANAFAMPLAASSEGLRLGMVKRVYAILMMAALASQILAVVVATLATSSLATTTRQDEMMTRSVSELLKEHYYLEWISCRWHFLSGVIFFVLGVGIRAWVTIVCPIIARGALGIILSCALLCLAFLQDLEPHDKTGILDGGLSLPICYLKLLWRRAQKRPLFALALFVSLLTQGYLVSKIPHIVHYLTS